MMVGFEPAVGKVSILLLFLKTASKHDATFPARSMLNSDSMMARDWHAKLAIGQGLGVGQGKGRLDDGGGGAGMHCQVPRIEMLEVYAIVKSSM